MRRAYIKPDIKTIQVAPQHIIASSVVSPEIPEDDERVDATANQTVFEAFDGLSDFENSTNYYEQRWNSRYDWE